MPTTSVLVVLQIETTLSLTLMTLTLFYINYGDQMFFFNLKLS